MKKQICGILLGFILCGTLSGCITAGVPRDEYNRVVSELEEARRELGEREEASSFALKEETGDSQEQSSASGTDSAPAASGASQLLLDQEGIKITYTGTNEGYLGLEMSLEIENHTDQDIAVMQRGMSINNKMVDAVFASKLSAGKTANATLYVFSDDIAKNKISEVQEVELSFLVVESNTYTTLFQSEKIQFQP